LLVNGDQLYTGPAGYIENLAVRPAIRSPIPWHRTAPGERIDPRQRPIVPPPPNVAAIAFYAGHRDRFDDPDRPRIPGAWEKLLVAPLNRAGELVTWVPSDPLTPIVLAGLDADGKVARWTATAKETAGRNGIYFALAGDHYSGIRANGYH